MKAWWIRWYRQVLVVAMGVQVVLQIIEERHILAVGFALPAAGFAYQIARVGRS
ncbi:MAG: hypothetical protein ACU0DW_04250 [Shimia sp.]